MIFNDIDSKNIRLVLIDDFNSEQESGGIEKEKNDCLIEIRIKKSILYKLFSGNISYNIKSDITVTERELEVLKYIAKGLNNPQISKKLHISIHTTKAHIRNIFSKLSVQDRTLAVVKAIKDKIINV